MDDVIINKIAVIERCIARINEEYTGHEQAFRNNKPWSKEIDHLKSTGQRLFNTLFTLEKAGRLQLA